ncbi:cytosolic non-specific dipeptidase [Rhipicephalus sanguineus]|uniref:cytosolic non-specific dipeptidase n=1 Tax=Rhipicephalus sanguineus TaxID=34632 RepID=UPI0018953A39|nr:cytosolic non-specific dipeptidase [Rhipicephalus sanguineus]
MDESAIPKDLASVFRIIEEDKDDMLSWLKELVAIPTVSAELSHRKDIMRLIEQTQEKLKKHGMHVTLEPLGDQNLSDGSKVPYPPLLLASTTHDAKRKTLCVYGHLDVQPARKDDGWDTEPFQPVEKDGRLFGRGTAHNKGPLTACIWALCAYLQSTGRPPLNVRMLIDSMQEVDSQGIAAYLKSSKKSDLLGGIDYVCIADGVWLRPKTPCLTYALRGICHFQVEVTCADADLHSGIYGGTVIEAMPDLMYLLNSLTDAEGRIKVPGIYDEVLPLSHEERKVYEGIEFDVEQYRKELGVPRLATNDKVELLMRRWRYPTLSIHGVEGAHWSSGDKAVIPARVVGKFSIRTVPNQKVQKVRECVEKHLQEQFTRRGSPNQVKVIMSHCADPWFTDPSGPNFQAAEAAAKDAYGVVPDKTRGGFTVGPAKLIQDHVCRDMLVMSINPPGCGFHSQNENISVADLVSGAKLFAAYMHELSKLK